VVSLDPLAKSLSEIVETQKKAEEENVSRQILKRVTKALREAFYHLPREEYDWLSTYGLHQKKSTGKIVASQTGSATGEALSVEEEAAFGIEISESTGTGTTKGSVFDLPGPLTKTRIVPASAIIKIRQEKKLRVIGYDRNKNVVDSGFTVSWNVKDGAGTLDKTDGEYVTYRAPEEPGVMTIEAVAAQNNKEFIADTIITVTASVLPESTGKDDAQSETKGLPGYTFKKASGELWRSYFDLRNNLVVINNGHSDYLYAIKVNVRKLRYICKLYAKELVLSNFPGVRPEELLERMIELQLYTEENL
ncbi:MAG: hypothetical protein HN368_08030, partial [Spirochaetales bacterium]|nr:hypothetical protein [Spirochaetales bacterium]